MSMNKANSSKSPTARASTTELRDEQLVRIAYDHMTYSASTVDGDPDLTTNLMGELREGIGQRFRDNDLRRHFSIVESFKPVSLVRLETLNISVNLQCFVLRTAMLVIADYARRFD
ncbi:MAG: hypothetical protein VX589_03865 [Myxococcota bacterium]|nr:hypothetical protein [Myxococcota bacterium]